MINITDNKWRAFIELTAVSEDGGTGTFYFDITRRPLIIQQDDGTAMLFDDATIVVKESAKEIIEACDRLVEMEQDKKAAEARAYMEATMARAEATKAKVGE